MIRSPREPKPVPVRKYRYTKLRWRVLVHLLDAVGERMMKGWRLLRPMRAWDAPRRILVVQLDHLGDSVLSSPLFPRLRAAYPGVRIDVLASPSNRAVFQADPNVDEVILADRNWFERRPGQWSLASAVWNLGRSLRDRNYDLGIDVRGDVLSLMVLALAGIPRRLGWEMGGGGFLLTDRADWVPGRHEVESRVALAEALGLPASDDPPRVEVHATDRDRARVARMLRESWPDGPVRRESRALVHAGHASAAPVATIRRLMATDVVDDDADSLHAGRFGESSPMLAVHLGAGTSAKRWPVAHWATLVERFLADGWRVVVVGGAEDRPLADRLTPHAQLRDWTGRLAVTETTALLERADLFIGADSGPAHLAACAGVPSVVLFSGTNLVEQWHPWSRSTMVIKNDVACRPCHRKVCPLADHPCMSGLTPHRVHAEARRWWAQLHREESPHVPV